MANPLRILSREPLHPPTTHFPMGLFPMTVLFDLLSLYQGGESSYTRAAFVVMIAALGTAGIAVTTGFIHLIQDVSPDSRAWRVAIFHMGVQLTAVGILLVSLLLRVGHTDDSHAPAAAILLSALGTSILLFGGWLGGRLVYHHAVSVRPQASASDQSADGSNRRH